MKRKWPGLAGQNEGETMQNHTFTINIQEPVAIVKHKILEACLTAEQRKAGLHLSESEDKVELRNKYGEVLATWNSSTATIEEIRSEADIYQRIFSVGNQVRKEEKWK